MSFPVFLTETPPLTNDRFFDYRRFLDEYSRLLYQSGIPGVGHSFYDCKDIVEIVGRGIFDAYGSGRSGEWLFFALCIEDIDNLTILPGEVSVCPTIDGRDIPAESRALLVARLSRYVDDARSTSTARIKWAFVVRTEIKSGTIIPTS